MNCGGVYSKKSCLFSVPPPFFSEENIEVDLFGPSRRLCNIRDPVIPLVSQELQVEFGQSLSVYFLTKLSVAQNSPMLYSVPFFTLPTMFATKGVRFFATLKF